MMVFNKVLFLGAMTNNIEPDQMAPSTGSDLGLHCFHTSFICQSISCWKFGGNYYNITAE